MNDHYRVNVLHDPSPPTKRATIWDVAEHAGVSHQTVSRYLRHRGEGVRPGTALKVQAAIDALHYRPNRAARSMRTTAGTGRLAIVLPMTTTLHPARLLDGAARVAHAAGFTVDIFGLEEPRAVPIDRALDLADTGGFDGILVMLALADEAIQASTTPIVRLRAYDDELRAVGPLADATTCAEVVRHLAAAGHRHFLHITGDRSFTSARNREAVFTATVDELGLHGTVVEGDWHAPLARAAVAALPPDSPISAIVAANDTSAMGAIRGCLDRGWSVPGDVSVFGWDDNEHAAFASPSVSSVAMDAEGLGRDAMGELVALVRGEPAPAPTVRSLHRLVVRESTGPARRRLAAMSVDDGRPVTQERSAGRGRP